MYGRKIARYGSGHILELKLNPKIVIVWDCCRNLRQPLEFDASTKNECWENPPSTEIIAFQR
jgi:hypothetical protein